MPGDDVQVGALILNYHEAEATLACVRRLLEREGRNLRVLWLEGDAEHTLEAVRAALDNSGLPWVQLDPLVDALPAAGQIGLIPIAKDPGYGPGNNVGFRFLHRHGVPFAWVMSNDTLLERGTSQDLLRAAEARPEVAIWGMTVTSTEDPDYVGLRIQPWDFAVARVADPAQVETDPLGFINGCALFVRTGPAMDVGGIPEEYFMYYEDQAFTWELRKRGHKIGIVDSVAVWHAGSLTTGHRSRFTEFYCRRNRWHFIKTYFPDQLRSQQLRFFFYQIQKLFFRFRFDRIVLEFQAYLDFKAGRLGCSERRL